MPKYTEQDFFNQVNYLNQTKNLMREAIINKGQEVDINTPFRDYADKISNIQGSSGIGGQNSNILHFKNMTEMNSYPNVIHYNSMAFVYDNEISNFQGVFRGAENEYPFNYYGYKLTGVDTENNLITYDTLDDTLNINTVRSIRTLLKLHDSSFDEEGCYLIEKINDNEYAVYTFYLYMDLTVATFTVKEIPFALTDYTKLILRESSESDKINLVMDFPSINDNILYRQALVQLAQQYNGPTDDFRMIRYIVNLQSNTVSSQVYNTLKYIGYGGVVYCDDLDFKNRNLYCVYMQPSRQISQSEEGHIISYYHPNTEGDVQISSNNALITTIKDYSANNFEKAPVPFTADAVSVLDGWFYGSNGVEQGEMFDNKSYDIQNEIDKLPKRLDLYFSGEKVNTAGLTNCTNYFFNKNILISPILNTSLVTSMYHMFYDCYNMTTVSLYNTSLVTNMASMFYFCYNITTVPNFNTINVTNMSAMFDGCNNLVRVPNFDTSNVTDMSSMFGGMNWAGKTNMRHVCENLISVPNFNTCNVTTMYWMFAHCENLASVPNFNTSKVTNMQSMFQNCYNLTAIPNFYTPALVDAAYMLGDCYSLTSVPNFNTSKVNYAINMFMNCNNLKSVPNFNFTSLKNGWGMFKDCTNLTTVPAFNIRGTTNICNMFYNCINLTDASYHNIATVLPQASSLSNTDISNTGLNSDRFTTADKYVLADKGYTGIEIPNAQQYIISYE